MPHVEPITRTASAASSATAPSVPTPLRHPTPDLHSLQGGYFRNIMNLEQMAEEMSQDGSDIGEEIKKMHEEQKSRQNSMRSRQSSIQSSHQGDANGVRGGAGGGLGRMESGRSRTSSHGNNIVGVNGAARWGGYSPTGYISSPVGSVHSGSWSHASMPRKASASGSSRLAQVVEPSQEGRPLDSPMSPSTSSRHSLDELDPLRQSSVSSLDEEVHPSRRPSQSSFAQRYDEFAGQIEESLEDVPPSPPKHDPSLVAEEHDEQEREGTVTPPQRPRSTDTFREAQAAFRDFDGVHFSPQTEEVVELDENGAEVRRVSARDASGGFSLEAASMLRTPRPQSLASFVPPPAEGMLYYPAPVPRMLNLPKRLSQLPSANVQAKRRTQLLGQLSPGARQSAPWLSQMDVTDPAQGQRSQGSRGSSSGSHPEHPRGMLNQRMSTANLQNLPPQLRASVFFDHQSVSHDVEVKSESAVATLDSILAASATAPVSVFTDHPYAGDVRKSTYAAPENMAARRSTTTLAPAVAADVDEKAKTKRRRSSFGNLLRRTSSGNMLAEELERPASRASALMDLSVGGKKLQRRKSQHSLADDLDRQTEAVRTPGKEISEPDLQSGLIGQAQNAGPEDEEGEGRVASGSRPATAQSRLLSNEGAQIEEDFQDEETREDVEGEPVYTQPTTLLAELQVRKAQQKSRNKTAATAFPNGMHSTLLQMDAVEEINKRKRQTKRVPLAWEDPGGPAEEEHDEDDEVPLGMLFPAKNGATNRRMGDDRDWNRPMGLMEKRTLEDNEPLASRRNRLQGLPPSHNSPGKRPASTIMPSISQLHLAGQPDAPPEGKEEDEAEEGLEGETLAQRLRRLRTKSVLDTAISSVAPQESNRPLSTFTDDVLGQFGGLDVKDEPATNSVEAAEPPAVAGADEEETLGQRRARLQREREASGTQDQQPPRPNLTRNNSSMANLLATNPVVGGHARHPSREHTPAHGTLLHANARQQAKQKAHILHTNVRSSSYYLDKPLVAGGNPRSSRAPGLVGQQQQQQQRQSSFGAMGGFHNGLGGPQPPLQTSASTPMLAGGNNYPNSYFPSMPYGNSGAGMGYGMQQQPLRQSMMMNPAAYQHLAGGAGGTPMSGYGYGGGFGGAAVPMTGGGGAPFAAGMGMGMGMPMGMPMGMGMAEEAALDAKQRAAIDHWRMSVAQ